MKLPWVSRSRFEDLEKRCAELEAERRLLMDRVMELSSQRPLFAQPLAPVHNVAESAEPQEKDQEPAPAVPTRVTISGVRNLANTQAEKAARMKSSLWKVSPGSKVVNG